MHVIDITVLCRFAAYTGQPHDSEVKLTKLPMGCVYPGPNSFENPNLVLLNVVGKL